MVVKVKLDGLNIVRARGRYYVYLRETGHVLLRGFEGSRDDLLDRLAEPDMLAAYNAKRKRDLKNVYPEKSLGWLVEWFTEQCPEFGKLSDATKKDYLAAFAYLRPEFDAPLETITQASLYETRDTCTRERWPRFADKMMAAMSSMFTQAVKRGKMPMNPAMGIEKAHTADPNANREWSQAEWDDALRLAPAEIRTVLMLARHAGFRGQTIAALQWKHYQPDPRFGKCFRVVVRKNKEPVWIPAAPELQAYIDGIDRSSLNIATRADGSPWKNEKLMQAAVSHFLRGIEATSAVEPGATLHGLRVSYAAEKRRDGADTGDVAAALGDRSTRMGEHYTRHVENESKVIRAFDRKRGA
jgi:site-specific recombinase XerD